MRGGPLGPSSRAMSRASDFTQNIQGIPLAGQSKLRGQPLAVGGSKPRGVVAAQAMRSGIRRPLSHAVGHREAPVSAPDLRQAAFRGLQSHQPAVPGDRRRAHGDHRAAVCSTKPNSVRSPLRLTIERQHGRRGLPALQKAQPISDCSGCRSARCSLNNQSSAVYAACAIHWCEAGTKCRPPGHASKKVL